MQTNIVTVGASGDVSAVVETILSTAQPHLADKSARLDLVFASTQQSIGAVMAALAPRLPGVTLLGASTAGEFTQVASGKGGVSFVLVSGDFKVSAGVGHSLRADPEAAVAEAMTTLIPRDRAYPHRTAILLLDPLAGRSEEVTMTVGAHLGPTVPVVGGAAGDDLKMQQTWVGLGGTAESDAIVLCVVDTRSPLGVGVAHGHRVLSRPLKVTSAKDNVVHTIDGRPAWDVWVEETKSASSATA